MSDLSFDPDTFSGCVRLFPIPNLVMFPHVIQPIHVFEHRYRSLLSDALADDRLIALPVLSRGWESNYDHRPALERVACLTKVVSHQQTADGRSNVLVVGLNRIRLLDELPACHAYREAHVKVLADHGMEAVDIGDHDGTHRHLLRVFKSRLHPQITEAACLDELLDREVSLGVLTDLIAHTLELDWAVKVQLLSEPDVHRRAMILCENLEDVALQPVGEPLGAGRFPPDFSAN